MYGKTLTCLWIIFPRPLYEITLKSLKPILLQFEMDDFGDYKKLHKEPQKIRITKKFNGRIK